MRDAPDLAKSLAVHSDGLTKRYGDTLAVDRLDLDIPQGEFFGLLGPNGSGKTTTIHMLSTLVRPTSGRALVAGYDVGRNGVKVRGAIGVCSRIRPSIAPSRSGRICASPACRRALECGDPDRAGELRNSLRLAEQATQAGRCALRGDASGGGDCRGVIDRLQALFLDEPTIGLDLPNRERIWRFIERLRAQTGMTVLLTTHYLEEAANCHRVAFIKNGRIVKSGAPQALIDDLSEHVIEIEGEKLDDVVNELKATLGDPVLEEERASFRFSGSPAELATLQANLTARVGAVKVRRPNLNDVFLWVSETDSTSRRPGERGVKAAR